MWIVSAIKVWDEPAPGTGLGKGEMVVEKRSRGCWGRIVVVVSLSLWE